MLTLKIFLTSEKEPPKTGETFFAYHIRNGLIRCYHSRWDAPSSRFTGAFCTDGSEPTCVAWSRLPSAAEVSND